MSSLDRGIGRCLRCYCHSVYLCNKTEMLPFDASSPRRFFRLNSSAGTGEGTIADYSPTTHYGTHTPPPVVPGATATPFVDNLRYFNVVIEGPPDTPYQGEGYLERRCRLRTWAATTIEEGTWRDPIMDNVTSATPFLIWDWSANGAPSLFIYYVVFSSDKREWRNAGGVFKLELFLPDDYPMCPPKVGQRFL